METSTRNPDGRTYIRCRERVGVCRGRGLLSVFGCRVDYASTCAEAGVSFVAARMAATILMDTMERLGVASGRSALYATRI